MSATPGPWRVEQGTTLIWGACDAADNSSWGMGYPIAECRTFPAGLWATGPYSDEAEANAKLIAAAPDMLEALQAMSALYAFAWDKVDGGLMMMGSGVERFEAAHDKARAAIAKATQP